MIFTLFILTALVLLVLSDSAEPPETTAVESCD